VNVAIQVPFVKYFDIGRKFGVVYFDYCGIVAKVNVGNKTKLSFNERAISKVIVGHF